MLLGFFWDNGKENGNYYSVQVRLYWDHFRVLMGLYCRLYWGYMGIIEKEMETTIYSPPLDRICWGLSWDSGKQNGNYRDYRG